MSDLGIILMILSLGLKKHPFATEIKRLQFLSHLKCLHFLSTSGQPQVIQTGRKQRNK